MADERWWDTVKRALVHAPKALQYDAVAAFERLKLEMADLAHENARLRAQFDNLKETAEKLAARVDSLNVTGMCPVPGCLMNVVKSGLCPTHDLQWQRSGMSTPAVFVASRIRARREALVEKTRDLCASLADKDAATSEAGGDVSGAVYERNTARRIRGLKVSDLCRQAEIDKG